MNIKEIILVKHCFGEDIEIDGVDFNEIDPKNLQEWMFDKIKNMRQYDFIEMFKHVIWSQLSNHETVYHDKCDQCGDYNSETILKFTENEKSK